MGKQSQVTIRVTVTGSVRVRDGVSDVIVIFVTLTLAVRFVYRYVI
jgi:hypothetical protein